MNGRDPQPEPARASVPPKVPRIHPDGFRDETYVETERAPKWRAHRAWTAQLGRDTYEDLLARRKFAEIATQAVRIESRTQLLFSFEKMAIRDAVRTARGARLFAEGLHGWLYEPGKEAEKFTRWCEVVASLPRRQTRVLTWPVVSVFGFIARPRVHLYLKPLVTRAATGRAASRSIPLRAAMGHVHEAAGVRPHDPA